MPNSPTTHIGTGLARQLVTGVRAFVVLTIILGIAYPVAVWAVGQTAFHDNANGQLIQVGGRTVGSAIIGQSFDDPALFHSRPGAYDPLATGGSNLGPSNPDLIAAIERRRADVATIEGVAPSAVPPDAVTASGSGLDPYISPAYAELQADRVARENGLSAAEVADLVDEHTDGRILGYLGEPKVNVLELNLAVRSASAELGD